MQTLGPSNSELTGGKGLVEKLIRLAIPAGLIWGGILLFNKFAPTLIEFFNNFWTLVLVGVPAAMLVMYVLSNPTLLWMQYKSLCHKLTSLIIKLDPLSFMDRYIDILMDKIAGLRESKQALNAKKIELERLMTAIVKSVDENMRKAKATRGIDQEEAAHLAGIAAGDKQSYDLYKPIFDRIVRNLDFLDKLEKNWARSIDKLKHEVDRKRTEFKTLKEMAKALGQAEEFARGDTEAGKIYKESVLALEESVTQKIAYIEEFEKNSQSAMKGIDIEKKMMDDEGMEMLDQYMQNGSLFLPEEKWTDAVILSSAPLQKKTTGGSNEFQNMIKLNNKGGEFTINTKDEINEFQNLLNLDSRKIKQVIKKLN